MRISDCRAFSPFKTVPVSLATDFLSVENIAIFWYAQARRIRQPQNQNNFSNRLAFPNRDRILLGGLNEAFRENSVRISECRTVPGCQAYTVATAYRFKLAAKSQVEDDQKLET